MGEEQEAEELPLVGTIVDVHVDEAGEHEGARVAGGLGVAAGDDARDPRAADDDPPARLPPEPGIHDRDVRELEAAVGHVHRGRSEPRDGDGADQADGHERDDEAPPESAHECAQPPPAPRAHPAAPISHARPEVDYGGQSPSAVGFFALKTLSMFGSSVPPAAPPNETQ